MADSEEGSKGYQGNGVFFSVNIFIRNETKYVAKIFAANGFVANS